MKTFVFASCLIAFFVSTAASAQNVHGILQVVKGEVQILSVKDGRSSPAKVGVKVFPKDTVITGKDSRAKIMMVDKNVINVAPDTKLEIANYEFNPAQGKKEVLLNVIYGKVRSKVEQKYDGAQNKFQVKTPTAVAGVRGTDFLASFQPQTQTSQVVTFHGEVAFGQLGPNGTMQNPVAVRPGQFTQMIGTSAPPPPQPMPPSQLASLDLESNVDAAVGKTLPSEAQPRSPSQDNKGDKKPDTPHKSEAAPLSPGGKTPPPPQGGTHPGQATLDRRVASTPAGSMLLPEDLASSPVGAAPEFNNVLPPPPVSPLPLQPITCEFCSRLIESGNTQLRLIITNQ